MDRRHWPYAKPYAWTTHPLFLLSRFVTTDIIVECTMLEDQAIFSQEKMNQLLDAVFLKTCKIIPHPMHVTIVLMTSQDIKSYNARYRNKNMVTNVLAFPTVEKNEPWAVLPGQPIILGDIFICWERTLSEAKEQGKSPHHHAMHLAIHGFLHLLHYDHEGDDEAEEMENLERAIFHDHAWPDPYLERANFLRENE